MLDTKLREFEISGHGTAIAGRIERLEQMRWSKQRANAWYSERPWLCGFNFLPSYAVNFIEMWSAECFDTSLIRLELAWAQSIGFNTLRTNIPFTLWQTDRTALLERIDLFLSCAEEASLGVVLCLFDDCGFSGNAPEAGPQGFPIPGVHNSRAIASPGRDAVIDRKCWPDLFSYTTEIVSRFGQDSRLLFWDLYNEPGNLMVFGESGQAESDPRLEPASLELMLCVVECARAAKPNQPICVGAWHVPMPWEKSNNTFFEHPIDRAAFAISDLINFHCYQTLPMVEKALKVLKKFDRPIMCTEWMARSVGSRIIEQLPLFQTRKVGAWQWGLVNGKTQTHIPWPAVKEGLENYSENESEWFHDLLHADGQPYCADEVELISRLTKQAPLSE